VWLHLKFAARDFAAHPLSFGNRLQGLKNFLAFGNDVAAVSRFCVHRRGKLCAFRASAMNIRGLGTQRLRLKLRFMSDEDLWWQFVNRREECSHEFWEELEHRKAAGTLSDDSPFWTMGNVGRPFHTRGPGNSSNLIELTREDWEARRRRKMFRVISA
jgi:hypothetical protein